jgi:hypothetical protein
METFQIIRPFPRRGSFKFTFEFDSYWSNWNINLKVGRFPSYHSIKYFLEEKPTPPWDVNLRNLVFSNIFYRFKPTPSGIVNTIFQNLNKMKLKRLRKTSRSKHLVSGSFRNGSSIFSEIYKITKNIIIFTRPRKDFFVVEKAINWLLFN